MIALAKIRERPVARPDTDVGRAVATVIVLWAVAVASGSALGLFALFPLPLFGALVALLLVATATVYVLNEPLRGMVERFGLRRLTVLHIWRVPAALAFFYFGSHGLLPPLFVALAGGGDLLAGIFAILVVTALPRSRPAHLAFHAFGMADFVLAVGTGLTFALRSEPLMGTIALFPLALIPLLGVPLSGATHVMAFDLLRRRLGPNRVG